MPDVLYYQRYIRYDEMGCRFNIRLKYSLSMNFTVFCSYSLACNRKK